jgi:hypothetical protein
MRLAQAAAPLFLAVAVVVAVAIPVAVAVALALLVSKSGGCAYTRSELLKQKVSRADGSAPFLAVGAKNYRLAIICMHFAAEVRR